MRGSYSRACVERKSGTPLLHRRKYKKRTPLVILLPPKRAWSPKLKREVVGLLKEVLVQAQQLSNWGMGWGFSLLAKGRFG